jgi:uncharacterized tellurite resistance protein B-like protein
MLETFRKFFSDLAPGSETARRFDDNDYRLAAAALLVHAAGIDGEVSGEERELLRALLRERFELDDEAADALLVEATEVQQNAVDLYEFTSLIGRALDEAGRARIIEMMWRVVMTDRRVSEFEDNLIWRAADLLGVSRNERIALRDRVAVEMKRPDGGDAGES